MGEWIRNNPASFFENRKPLYRNNVLDGFHRYDEAPRQYLEEKLKSLPDAIKWYVQVFQIIFFTGFMAIALALCSKSLDVLLTWNNKPSQGMIIAITISYIVFLVIGTLWKPGTSGNPLLSDLVQRVFFIKINIRELELEMFYIALVLEDRFPQMSSDQS